MITKKYDFTGEVVDSLRRIVAARDFANVKSGDIGGWIGGEKNLSHDGNAWVSDEAKVYGYSLVYGNAKVYGDAWVSGKAQVYGDALIAGREDWLLVGPAKSSGWFTTAYRDEKLGVRVACGCFSGTVREFSESIEKTHAGNPVHLQQYRLFCQLVASNFGVEA